MITVVGRKLIIPETDKQIGTTYDNNSEVRHIRINRITTGGVDLSNLRFKLDLEYADTTTDTCLLAVEVQDEYVLLTWTIPAACLTHKGTVWIAIRAYDENGTVKWATNRGAVYVGHTIFDGEAYSGHLAEFEQLEERITQKIEILDTNESERQTAEEQREANEERRINNEAEWQRQAEAAINTANETLREAQEQAGIATQKATESTQKAKEASDSATAAAGSAATASEKEATATQKAKEASDSATAAAGSAATASEKEATATQKAKEASDSATAAAGSASISSEKAATATQKAGEAEASATAAARSAEQAEQAAGCDGTAKSISATDTNGIGSTTVQGQLDALTAPVFDDTGVVADITGFQIFLDKLTSGMKIRDFFRNLKAGLKFVLHTGQLVNNGLCNEPGKYPLDAAYGRTLLEMIGNTADLPGGAADIVSAIVTQNSNLNSKANSSDVTELNNKITSCYKNAVLLCQEKSGAITLSDSIYNYKILRFENNNFGFTTFPISDGGSNIIRVSTISMSGSIMVLCCGAWNVTNNGKTLTPSYMVQVNIDSSKTVTLFNTSASLTWNIVGYNQ